MRRSLGIGNGYDGNSQESSKEEKEEMKKAGEPDASVKRNVVGCVPCCLISTSYLHSLLLIVNK